jgi:hypothetical protein
MLVEDVAGSQQKKLHNIHVEFFPRHSRISGGIFLRLAFWCSKKGVLAEYSFKLKTHRSVIPELGPGRWSRGRDIRVEHFHGKKVLDDA